MKHDLSAVLAVDFDLRNGRGGTVLVPTGSVSRAMELTQPGYYQLGMVNPTAIGVVVCANDAVSDEQLVNLLGDQNTVPGIAPLMEGVFVVSGLYLVRFWHGNTSCRPQTLRIMHDNAADQLFTLNLAGVSYAK